MCRKAEESQLLLCWAHFSATETELIPNLLVGDSERAAGKSKKREGLWKPKSKPTPNRPTESDIFDSVISGMSCIDDHAASTSDAVADVIWSGVFLIDSIPLFALGFRL
jgi:hypothetical protein